MKTEAPLTKFQLALTQAIVACGDDAYGVPIREWLEAHGYRVWSYGDLYQALGELEQRGLVWSRDTPGGESRAGHPKRVYRLG